MTPERKKLKYDDFLTINDHNLDHPIHLYAYKNDLGSKNDPKPYSVTPV